MGQEESAVAAIARLETQMEFVLNELGDVKEALVTLNKARWLGSGFLIAIGAGGLAGLQKLALIFATMK